MNMLPRITYMIIYRYNDTNTCLKNTIIFLIKIKINIK